MNLITKRGAKITRALMAALLLSASFGASAVTVSAVSDSDNSPTNFDISLNTVNTIGNISTIGLGIGAGGFAAVAPVVVPAALPFATAFDTMQLTITAAPGTKIVSLGFSEQLDILLGAGSYAQASGSVAVAGQDTKGFSALYMPPTTVQMTNLNTTHLFAAGLDQITVTVTNSLVAISSTGQVASILKSLPQLVVETAPIPLPPAVWLFGVGLAGLAAWRKRPAGGAAAA